MFFEIYFCAFRTGLISPKMDIPAPAIFLGILLAIPLQMCFSPERTSDMDYYLKQTLDSLNFYWEKIRGDREDPPDNEDIVVLDEDDLVDQDEKENDYFGCKFNSEKLNMTELNSLVGTTVPRDPKPPNVKFSVGDVVEHKKLHYRGVIVGWDEVEKAPEKWLTEVRGSKEKRRPSQPNYAILIDTRSRLTPQLSYVLQENLQIAEGRVIHPLVIKFFEGMESASKYKMRPILRKVYPND